MLLSPWSYSNKAIIFNIEGELYNKGNPYQNSISHEEREREREREWKRSNLNMQLVLQNKQRMCFYTAKNEKQK